MSFLAPSAPAAPLPPPPPPNPPTLGSDSVQGAGAAQRAAAAAAGGSMGFNDTVKTGPQGAAAPTTAGQQLFGA